jgi:glycosyltransferase involved in cell wall biosynthesis/DNA-binding transcriptional ArsR family regulator
MTSNDQMENRPMTRALLFEGEIRDREHQKSLRKETPVSGFDVFVSSFSKALLTYSRRAEVYFTAEAAALSFQRSAPPWLKDLQERIRLISAYDPSPLKALEDLVLLSVGPEMLNFAWIRSQLQKPEWPIVAVMHSLSPPPRIRYFLTSALFSRLYPYDALVCATHAAKKAIENLFLSVPEVVRSHKKVPFEIPVIPFGVETQEHANQSKEAARQKLRVRAEERAILYFGTFSPTDKCDLLPLLIAYSQLPRREHSKLILAGDDTQFRMAAALKGAASELGCGDSVDVLPDVSKDTKLNLFAAADIFVSPSENTQESFSIPIAEAMASGLPVVASDWAGHGELVEHGKTGFLIPTFMAPITEPLQFLTLYSGIYQEKLLGMSTAVDVNLMSKSLQVLLENPDLCAAMGEEGRRRAQVRFDWKVVMGQYDELWDALSERGRKCRPAPDPFECSSFQEVFRHYPTETLHSSWTLQLTSGLGEKSSQILNALGAGQHFDAAVFQQLMKLLDAGPASIAQLVQSTGSHTKTPQPVIERHIGRLLKYGLVSLEGELSKIHGTSHEPEAELATT